MPNMQILKAKTLTSKKAIREIIAAYPAAAKIQRRSVPGVGYALYIKDADGNNIAHASHGHDGIVLNAAA